MERRRGLSRRKTSGTATSGGWPTKTGGASIPVRRGCSISSSGTSRRGGSLRTTAASTVNDPGRRDASLDVSGGGRGIRTPMGREARWISSPLPYQLRLALRALRIAQLRDAGGIGRGGRVQVHSEFRGAQPLDGRSQLIRGEMSRNHACVFTPTWEQCPAQSPLRGALSAKMVPRLLCVVASLLLFGGCTIAHSSAIPTGARQYAPHSPSQAIETYFTGQTPSRHYEEVGVVKARYGARTAWSSAEVSDVLPELHAKARLLGADAIIIASVNRYLGPALNPLYRSTSNVEVSAAA